MISSFDVGQSFNLELFLHYQTKLVCSKSNPPKIDWEKLRIDLECSFSDIRLQQFAGISLVAYWERVFVQFTIEWVRYQEFYHLLFLSKPLLFIKIKQF